MCGATPPLPLLYSWRGNWESPSSPVDAEHTCTTCFNTKELYSISVLLCLLRSFSKQICRVWSSHRRNYEQDVTPSITAKYVPTFRRIVLPSISGSKSNFSRGGCSRGLLLDLKMEETGSSKRGWNSFRLCDVPSQKRVFLEHWCFPKLFIAKGARFLWGTNWRFKCCLD